MGVLVGEWNSAALAPKFARYIFQLWGRSVGESDRVVAARESDEV